MDNSKKSQNIEFDDEGHVIIPLELAARYGIKKGNPIRLSETPRGLEIISSSRLQKLYIEPTNLCNLDCRTCMRNAWDEPMGIMSETVFQKIIEGLHSFDPIPSVFFGGLGEPLLHPRIVDMVTKVKSMGVTVELITNGTLLTREMSHKLCKIGLDMIWVSLDGAKPDSYADVRLGAALPEVLENLGNLRYEMRAETKLKSDCDGYQTTKLGIAFVAMKRNIADLPEIIRIGQKYGADKFHISNVIPYTKDMIDDVLYYGALNNVDSERLIIPGLDINRITSKPLYLALRHLYGSSSGNNFDNPRNRCPFIDGGTGAVGWDGNISPCLPLLHKYTSYNAYIQFGERRSINWSIGNITERGLYEIWNSPEHLKFRERVQSFEFSPCTYCGSCELAETNEEDCYGNKFPTCGGCLWAQGVIQCP